MANRPSRAKAALEGRALAKEHIALRGQMRRLADALAGPTVYEQVVEAQQFDPLARPHPRRTRA